MHMKFFTFPNEFILPQLSASYHKRHHGLLVWNDTDACVVNSSGKFKIHDSFSSHYWHLIQMSKEYKQYANEDDIFNDVPIQTLDDSTGESCPRFPMRVFVNYVLDELPTPLAHVLNYELWINPTEFSRCMQYYGTFPFEVYFTQLMRKMLSQCNEVPWCRTISKISDAEYAFLLDGVPPLRHWNDKYPLFKHELESFHWMYRLEQSIQSKTATIVINPLSLPILDTGYYYNRTCDLITHVKLESTLALPIQGGILADVTGSGKTAVALALIMASPPSLKPHDAMMSALDDQFYFRSSATLVVTPNNLTQQWLQEIHKFIQVKHLKVVFVTNLREFKKVKLKELLEADIVLTTDVFLTSKRYQDEVSYQARCLIQFPFVEHETHSLVNMLAWRIAVNQRQPGFKHEGCVPLESIKWTRIVLDEIHLFFQPDRKTKPLPPLSGCFHWGLTGTPMFQNPHVMTQYIKFVGIPPPHWVPDFLTNFMDKCVHRFDGLELNAIERHLYLVDHTEREKQLLQCYDTIQPEKLIQLCSYFNLVDVDDSGRKIPNVVDMNQKIRLLTIDEIIRTVKKDKRCKIRDLESKIKYHDLAIRNVTEKIEESRQEIKKFQSDNLDSIIVIDVTSHATTIHPPPLLTLDHDTLSSQPSSSLLIPSALNEQQQQQQQPPLIVHDIRDVRDVIRSRKRRLDRMLKRRDQLLHDKRSIERSMSFFESKVDGVKQQPLEMCPICMSQTANVITQCGHMFCRACIIKCLKKKYQCPLCKTMITPADAHEIKIDKPTDGSNGEHASSPDHEDRILRYGSKLTRILELVRTILERNEKVIIFVQWSPLMNCIREMFRENKIELGVMVGNAMQQNAALKKFKTSSMHVLMGSIDNTGLDLIDANHLIFVHALLGEEYVVKALEDQAIARIHRNGQTRKVHIYWFITRGTLEEDLYLHTRCSN